MPNTLAHLGINSLITRSLIRKADLIFIYIGAIIPDIPWLIQRTILFVSPNFNAYDLRLYCIILASLFFSIIISAAISSFFNNAPKVFLILSMGALIHLLLDSIEIKWANGVHFFVPFNWELFNAGFFWPENTSIYVLTIFGLIYSILNWKKTVSVPLNFSTMNLPKITLIYAILMIYFLLPLFFLKSAEEADNHFVKTLRNYENRVGEYFEIDRGSYINNYMGVIFITPFKEVLKVSNLHLPESEIMSIRAKFISLDEIQIIDYHIHPNRDIFAYIGLLIILVFLFSLLVKNHFLIKQGRAEI